MLLKFVKSLLIVASATNAATTGTPSVIDCGKFYGELVEGPVSAERPSKEETNRPASPISVEELLGERVPDVAARTKPLPDDLRAKYFSPELTDRLAAHAMAYKNERAAKEAEFWRDYKNERRDVTAACTFDLRNGIVTIQGANYRLDASKNGKNYPTPYEMMILHAKKGDSIIFPDGKKFELGEFLGNGNATHVFSLCENGKETGQAIRIPFFAEADVGGVPAKMVQTLRWGQTISYAKRFSQAPEALNLVNHVPILGSGKVSMKGKVKTEDIYTYFIVPRLQISETGDSFLNRVQAEGNRVTPAEAEKYRTLKTDLELLEKAGFKQSPKQFGWDSVANRWILLDWE